MVNVYIIDNCCTKSTESAIKCKYNYTDHLAAVDIIFCRFTKKLDSSYLSHFKSLKYIVSFTTGVDHIDEEYCKAKQVQIVCLKDSKVQLQKITSSSEIALIYSLMASRNLITHLTPNIFQVGSMILKGDEKSNYCDEISETSFGIVGLGRIGTYVYKSLKSISNKILYYDPYVETNGDNLDKVENLRDLSNCGVVLIACTYNSETTGLINHKSLLQYINHGRTFSIVNIARGPIVDLTSLTSFMNTNKNTYYYIDTADSYTPTEQQDLMNLSIQTNRILSTTHIAGQAESAMKKAEKICLDFLDKALRT